MATGVPGVDGKERTRELLFTNVVEAAKSCQSVFGGKSQLAADTDTTVAILLLRLESILQHGIRQNITRTLIHGAFRHMSELSGLNLDYMKPEVSGETVFWTFIRTLLTRHENERFDKLKNVTSDYARGKAWLRASLNEHSLDKYIQMMLADQERLKSFYEPFAFLLDAEKAATMPQVISSLHNIYFALQIDTAELESGRCQLSHDHDYDDLVMDHLEPVMCADTPFVDGKPNEAAAARKKKKKKKRLAKIEESSTVSAPIASSACEPLGFDNITPDLIPVMDRLDLSYPISKTGIGSRTSESSTQDSLDQDSVLSSTLIGVSFTTAASRSLSSEPTSGGRPPGHHRSQSDDSNIRAVVTLGDISGSSPSGSEGGSAAGGKNLSVTELKQATLDMMRRKDEFERQNHVLQDALRQEKENVEHLQEELRRQREEAAAAAQYHEECQAGLRRELDILKSQLKKYVSAVHVLKNDRQNLVNSALNDEALLNTSGESVDVEEAYEQKLVQMATMHAELMELNDKLQSQVIGRDRQIHQLQNDINVLRGPLPGSEFVSVEELAAMFVNVWIPATFLRHSHHVYQVFVRIGESSEWPVYKRYNQFYDFHLSLRKEYPVVDTFGFPPKKTMGNKDAKWVEERRQKLQSYTQKTVNYIVRQHSRLRSNLSKESFTNFLPFFSPSTNAIQA